MKIYLDTFDKYFKKRFEAKTFEICGNRIIADKKTIISENNFSLYVKYNDGSIDKTWIDKRPDTKLTIMHNDSDKTKSIGICDYIIYKV